MARCGYAYAVNSERGAPREVDAKCQTVRVRAHRRRGTPEGHVVAPSHEPGKYKFLRIRAATRTGLHDEMPGHHILAVTSQVAPAKTFSSAGRVIPPAYQ